MYRNELGLDVGQANELKLAFRRFPFTNALIKKLCESGVLGDALDILRGDAQAVPVKRIVDLNADPVLEKGHSVVKHLKQGKAQWDRVRLAVLDPDALHYTYSSVRRSIDAVPSEWRDMTLLNRRTMMPRYLKGQRPANICLRDFFFENQHLIPRRWFDFAMLSKPLLFWGTICRNERDTLYVPGLSSSGTEGFYKYDRRVDLDDRYVRETYTYPCAVFAPTLVD